MIAFLCAASSRSVVASAAILTLADRRRYAPDHVVARGAGRVRRPGSLAQIRRRSRGVRDRQLVRRRFPPGDPRWGVPGGCRPARSSRCRRCGFQGLYLALSTLRSPRRRPPCFRAGVHGRRRATRRPPSVLGLSLAGDRAFFLFAAGALPRSRWVWCSFAAARSSGGLVALKTPPGCCAPCWDNLTATKLAVFATSAGIAGLAGGAVSVFRTQVGLERLRDVPETRDTCSSSTSPASARWGGCPRRWDHLRPVPPHQRPAPERREHHRTSARARCLGRRRNRTAGTKDVRVLSRSSVPGSSLRTE